MRAATPATAAPKRPPCRTDAGLPRSEVVTLARGTDGRLRMCFVPTRRRLALDDPRADRTRRYASDATPCAVRGRFVAYTRTVHEKSGPTTLMYAVDAKAWRTTIVAEAFSGGQTVGFPIEPYLECVLDAGGGLAWATAVERYSGLREVRFADGTVDWGQLVGCTMHYEPSSLALGKRYVYWREQGAAVSAPRDSNLTLCAA